MSATRRFAGGDLVIASHNQGKVREIRDLLAPYHAVILPAADLGLPEPEETGTTFQENAELKALAAARASGKPALSDDSGFCVAALDGDPGLYSARWAGPKKDFTIAMKMVWRQVVATGSADMSAWFACALCLAWPDGHTETVEGRVNGTLVWPPRGDAGFGYDPMFLPDGHTRTFGEMTAEEKHGWGLRKEGDGGQRGLSHRARAFDALVARCFG